MKLFSDIKVGPIALAYFLVTALILMFYFVCLVKFQWLLYQVSERTRHYAKSRTRSLINNYTFPQSVTNNQTAWHEHDESHQTFRLSSSGKLSVLGPVSVRYQLSHISCQQQELC